MATYPFSVVVVALIGGDALANCLDRLPLEAVECVVVLTKEMRTSSQWERRYPSVVFIEAPDEPVPLRRQRGVIVAKGDVVGLLEDTSWPHEGWCAAAQSALANSDTAAAGGPVRIAPTLLSRCQALGWSEYGAFTPDRVAQSPTGCRGDGSVRIDRVPGNNMAFRRTELLGLLCEEVNGLIEGLVCARLLTEGRQILYEPRMLVTLSACDQRNVSLATRLHHGRIYAASRLEGRGWPARLLHLAKATLLPILLTARAVTAMDASSRSNVSLHVLFWVSLMASAWALGEAVGSVRGAGQSMREWR